MNHTSSGGSTHAVIVGIDTYKEQAWPPLQGPVADAVRWVELLLGLGLLPENLTFLAAPSKDNADAVARLESNQKVVAVEPTQAEIDRVLNDEILDKSGDLLFVYWSGHGEVDEAGTRLLYLADATEGHKRSISPDHILDYLLKREGLAFADHVMIVDACANYYANRRGAGATPTPLILPIGRTASPADQTVFYSASQGQRADENRVEATGEFTSAVLTWLAKPRKSSWPPDWKALDDYVCMEFEKRRDIGALLQAPQTLWTPKNRRPLGQLPVDADTQEAAGVASITPSQTRRLAQAMAGYPLFGTPAGRTTLHAELPDKLQASISRHETPVEDMLQFVTAALQHTGDIAVLLDAAATLAGDGDRLDIQALSDLWNRQRLVAPFLAHIKNVKTDQVQAAYQIVRKNVEEVSSPSNLDEAIERLADDGPERLADFVLRLEAVSESKVPDQLFSLSADQLATLRSRIATDIDSPLPPHLFVDVGVVAEWPSYLRARLCRGNGDWQPDFKHFDCAPPTLEGLARGITDAVDWALGTYPGDLTIGIALPEHLFFTAPEQWEYGPHLLLGERYSVVLHSAERYHDTDRLTGAWRARFEDLRKLRDAGVAREVLWIPERISKTPREVSLSVLRESKKLVVAFEFLPVVGPSSTTRGAVTAALSAGAPYLLWMDENPSDWDKTRDKIRALVQEGEFNSFPNRVKGLRVASDDDVVFKPCTLRVIWDDPSLLPPREQQLGGHNL